MNTKRDTSFDTSDIEPSRLWWLISGVWVLMFSLVLIFVLSAEYKRYERLESRLVPATSQRVIVEL